MARQVSPVVQSECRFGGEPPFLYVGVWFKNKDELDHLITELTALRDSHGEMFDHVHLQQYGMSPSSKPGSAEVMFFRPGRQMTSIEHDLINDAETWISAARAK